MNKTNLNSIPINHKKFSDLIKIGTTLSVSLSLSLMMTACGKPAGGSEQAEQEKKQLQKAVDEKENSLTPLAGRYEGFIKSAVTGKDERVVLVLVSTIMIVQNPGRNDVTEMPTLGGNINLMLDKNDGGDIIPIAQFTSSIYDAKSGKIRLTGSIQTGTSIGAVINTFEGRVEGNKIIGNLFNTSRGDLGQLEVIKISEQ